MSIFYYACYALSYIYPAGGMPTYGQSVMVICLSACMNSWFMNNGKQGKIESNHSAYLYDFYSLIFHKKIVTICVKFVFVKHLESKGNVKLFLGLAAKS